MQKLIDIFFYLLGLAEKHQITADEIDSNLALKAAKTDETSQNENVKNTGKYTRQWTVDTTNTTPLRKSRRTSATSTDSADSISPVRRIKRKSQIVTATQTVASKVELVSKELNHLAAILHVYAGGLNFMK